MKHRKFIIIITLLIPFVFSGTADARTEKTERIGKISSEYMPSGVSLQWDDPMGFEKVIVVKNKEHLPANSSDGKIIYEGKGKTFTDTDLEQGATYYYAVIFIPLKPSLSKQALNLIEKPFQMIQDLPAPAKASVVTASVGSQILFFFGMFDSIKDFWFNIIRALQALIIFLGMRPKKKNGWGIVYDWETKEPLKNIVLSLVNERKEKISSVISDEAGRFGFLAEGGEYFLEVAKNKNYEFTPDVYDDNDLYGTVYKGKELTLKKEELLTMNVPLHSKMHQEMKGLKSWRLDFARIKSSRVLNFLMEFSFWIGFVVIIVSLLNGFSLIKFLLASFYVLVFFIRIFLMRSIKDWGIVLSSKNNRPIPFAVVRAFHQADFDKEQVGVCVSNTKGGFYLLVPPETVELSIKGRTLEGENFEKEASVTAKKGLINGVYYV